MPPLNTPVLMSAWDAVNPSTTEKCIVKCVFVDTVVDKKEGEEADCATSHVYVPFWKKLA